MSVEESNIAVVAERMKALALDMSDIKLGMRELMTAVAKLAVIEVRQTEASKANERAFTEIDKLDIRLMAVAARLSVIEQMQPLQKNTTDWVNRIGVLVISAVVMGGLGFLIAKPDVTRLHAVNPPAVLSHP